MKKVLALVLMFVILLSMSVFAGSTNTPGSKTYSLTTAGPGPQTIVSGKFQCSFIYVDSTTNTSAAITIMDGATVVRIIDLCGEREIPLYGIKFGTSLVVDFGINTGTATVNGTVPIF